MEAEYEWLNHRRCELPQTRLLRIKRLALLECRKKGSDSAKERPRTGFRNHKAISISRCLKSQSGMVRCMR